MAKIEPFEKYTEQYEDWFIKNRFVYESELKAVREQLPKTEKGIEIGVGTGQFGASLGIKIGDEVIFYLRKAGFKEFNFSQTIFCNITEIKKIENIKEGYGEGSFVVIKAIK